MKASVALVMIVLSGVTGSWVWGPASDAMKAIVGSYLEIHAQLAADKVNALKTPADAIVAKASEMGAGGAAMAAAAKTVGGATDLKTAREAFGALSDAVIAAAKAEGWKDLSDVKLAYCPMVNRSWMQKGEKIRNPYYGAGMLECGEFKKPQ
jgi:Cu(I)/Ag(I) efflux system membrane fusion protein